jgi:hypothetical protein
MSSCDSRLQRRIRDRVRRERVRNSGRTTRVTRSRAWGQLRKEVETRLLLRKREVNIVKQIPNNGIKHSAPIYEHNWLGVLTLARRQETTAGSSAPCPEAIVGSGGHHQHDEGQVAAHAGANRRAKIPYGAPGVVSIPILCIDAPGFSHPIETYCKYTVPREAPIRGTCLFYPAL